MSNEIIYLTAEGMNKLKAVFGARPLKRFIQSNVETLIAKKIVAGSLKPNDVLLLDVEDGQLVVNIKN